MSSASRGWKPFDLENTATGKRTSVPRHAEINDYTAVKICKQLGISTP